MKLGPSNLKCYVCDHVFGHERPVRLVVHQDGDWVFACGEDHTDDAWRVVGVGHLTGDDPSLHECADLEDAQEAERAYQGAAWIRGPASHSG